MSKNDILPQYVLMSYYAKTKQNSFNRLRVDKFIYNLGGL